MSKVSSNDGLLFPDWAQAYENGNAHRIASIYRLQARAWCVDRRLRADGGFPVRQYFEVTVVAEGVGLDATCWFFLKTRRLRVFAEQQLSGAVYIFHPRPDVILFSEAQRRFEKVAVLDDIVGKGTGSSPRNGAGPVAMLHRPVVYCGGR